MGSRVIGFRVPEDLAEEVKRVSGERGMTTADFLRKLVDDALYPPSADLAERKGEEVREDLTGMLAPIQSELDCLANQLKGFEERLDELVSKADLLTQRIDKIVEQENRNTQMVNGNFREWGNKVYLLLQVLDKHKHGELTGSATLDSAAAKLFDAKVRVADKHRGELPGPEKPKIIQGKTTKPGYKFLENLNLSVKERE